VSGLRRFLHLERPRSDAGEGADPVAATAERFEGVERPGAGPAAPSASGAELGRFGPDPEPGIELAQQDAGEQPFTRCMRCGMDHGIFATECSNCGARLDTEAQRELNERLWAERQAQAARDAAAGAERKELAARADAELSAARRAMAEELAREVGRRERARLDAEGLGGGWALPGGAGRWRLLRWLLRVLGG
jgi:hypothetical protein